MNAKEARWLVKIARSESVVVTVGFGLGTRIVFDSGEVSPKWTNQSE